ncbi:PEPxxWA-CTERM sorting domain-containing protein [Sphingobium sp. CR28]|uniref:PEPxxWA-CTERM sorting domain-containing protein n=1 Tax=Sphingobium sp. CR28 TaxID=3400272 RepID=UPI003FEDE8B1
MKNFTIIAALGVAAIATPSSAAVLACSTGPVIDLVNTGCTASGNDHLSDVESALAAALGVNASTLNLSLFGKSDDNPSFFTFSPNADPSTGKFTDWTVLDGTLIKYVTVKASTGFKLYEIAGAGASSGTNFSTLGLLNNGGNQPDISHLSFWTVPGAVPEPASWMMMIGGFAFAGGAMRRRSVKIAMT